MSLDWSYLYSFVDILFVTIMSFHQLLLFNFPLTSLIHLARNFINASKSAVVIVALTNKSRFALSKDASFTVRSLFLEVITLISRVQVLIGQNDIVLRTTSVDGSDKSLFSREYVCVWCYVG